MFRLIVLSLAFPFIAFAQTGTGETLPLLPLTPVITGPMEVEAGKTVVLDGSASIADPATVSYSWTLDGRIISHTGEAVLTLDQPGRYEITFRVRDRAEGEAREARGLAVPEADERMARDSRGRRCDPRGIRA